jgi:hypothetical protein
MWQNSQGVGKHNYRCGYCDKEVGPDTGYFHINERSGSTHGLIAICPNCERPSYFDFQRGGAQTPKPKLGSVVSGISDANLGALHTEARACTSFGAYTAAVMICRKILMHIAVEQGAPPNQSFKSYVDYLDSKGYIPPNGKKWVDKIRDRGNEANHEIKLMNEADATLLLKFTEMLLRFVYELPSMLEGA